MAVLPFYDSAKIPLLSKSSVVNEVFKLYNDYRTLYKSSLSSPKKRPKDFNERCNAFVSTLDEAFLDVVNKAALGGENLELFESLKVRSYSHILS